MPALSTSNAVLHGAVKTMEFILILNQAIIEIAVLHISQRHLATRFEVLFISFEKLFDLRAITHEIHLCEEDANFSRLEESAHYQYCVYNEPTDSTHVMQELRPDDKPAEHLSQTVLFDLLLC